MANHCYNYACFTGDSQKLKQLYLSTEKLRDPEDQYYISLYGRNYHLILGDPPLKSSSTGVDVYDVYGSKWFECNLDKQEEDGKITAVYMMGDSAWSPMLPLFRKICKKLDLACTGNYEEPGMNFAGEFTITKDTFHDEEMTYKQYQALHHPSTYIDDLYTEVEEGYFKSLQDVLDNIKADGLRLTSEELETLINLFNQYKYNQEQKSKESEEFDD